ncbi:bifunctional riboflavin kinase/FAD synthetase [Fredinandcohnia sp. QZ13]|uniref:bifunctional riboflavin kinase/FAD synthetase n=1 Tax=Fredinandcohnia sp. QZ13 TaxID=3073144 RepID=UPI0028533E63|nr:bifunctional riboflavin kinase/FAD synthetase [Fredinandcohnia sp. QZ13]MDR4886452.1 bifunctional riboflavin kinase/FAD synthetase [Fredinandcohnia sp. QZ13]
MKTIHITHPHSFNQTDLPPTVLALGYFDGVHLGHRKVVETAKKEAETQGIACSVMTFDPHPSIVLKKDVTNVEYITPLHHKQELFEEMDIDYLYIVNFSSEFASLSPQQFVDQYIIGLNVNHVVAGFDFTFGRFGKGTMEALPELANGRFTQTTVEKFTFKNEKVSSTVIRGLIQNGEVDQLAPLLGRFYTVKGIVVDGEKRGRTIGFPTANVKTSEDYIIPKMGVYAVRLKIGSTWHNGVCNLGVKPTFHENETVPSIEVHLFDFNEDIYKKDVIVEWHKRIRSEKKFSSIDELIKQIGRDKEQAKQYFEKIDEHTCFLP